MSQNTVGGLIKWGLGGGAIEVAGARNLIQKNTITGAECGILFEDEGGHLYRENVFLAAQDANLRAAECRRWEQRHPFDVGLW